MNKTLCTDYSSKICTDLNWNELNFTFYFISFTFVLICICIVSHVHAYSCVLTAFHNKRISNQFKSGCQCSYVYTYSVPAKMFNCRPSVQHFSLKRRMSHKRHVAQTSAVCTSLYLPVLNPAVGCTLIGLRDMAYTVYRRCPECQ